ncbi:MAG: mannose-1-phosphate guanylyltransferase [bacterium]|nr:mannose-1-phosphate guanylyltransferase [bacterium]
MQALILAGGSGTRFWPLSRRGRPKQLLPLDGEHSLLRQTVDRLPPEIEPAAVWVCTTRALAEKVRAELPEVPPDQILAEPEGRNTAPAIGWSIRTMPAAVRNEAIAVLPADHRFGDAAAFRRALALAARVAERDDRVVALGVTPRWAETGYGYLELGDELDAAISLRQVTRFTEKPDADTAQEYLRGGRHVWNAGIFVFRGTTLLRHLERFEPEIAADLEVIAGTPERTDEIYPRLKSISIDYAVMERLDSIVTLPLACEWNDLGSWEALAEVLGEDEDGNRGRGDALAIDARDNLLFADEGSVAVLGVEGLVVVRTADTVLVIPRNRSQEVRRIVDELKTRRRTDLL